MGELTSAQKREGSICQGQRQAGAGNIGEGCGVGMNVEELGLAGV